jgi:tetratricopeptide (TPR) repeat protein
VTRARLCIGIGATAACVLLLAQPACARQEPPSEQVEPAVVEALAYWDARVRQLESTLSAAPADVRTRRELVRTLLLLGRTESAERHARAGEPVELATSLGEVLYQRGRTADAEAAFRAAISGGASDAMRARARLAVLLDRRGERDPAFRELEQLAAWYRSGARLGADDLALVAGAFRMLGARDPQHFHDAIRIYEEAVQADTAHIDARLQEASLLLEKYNSTDAQALLREVLARRPGHPEALLLLAQAKRFDGSDEALTFARQALAISPDFMPARVFHAQLLLGLEDPDAAEQELERALAIDPGALEALAVLAGMHALAGNERAFEDARKKAHDLNPRYSTLFTIAADLAVQQRRYDDAARLAERAVRLDSSDWAGWGQLGLNQFRLGDVTAARTSLERAFAGDPFNVWIKNTLDLLDTWPEYETRTSARTALFLHRAEADLLALYAQPLAEEAIDSLARRYRYRPDGPVRVEVFPRHADFSVRTVGLTGLGALGVAFGEQLVMDSPAARERGAFNWGSTLWHELAHTFTLGASRGRVSRWLTEGLSVYEERRARPGWGEEISPDWARAWTEGRILPVSRLNEGFVRPEYPEQVMHSYLQASLVVELIEQEHGFDAILRMLREYGAGKSTDEVIRTALGTTPEQLDAAFSEYVETRFAHHLAAMRGSAGDPGAYVRDVAAGRALAERGDAAEAVPVLTRARDAFPEYAGRGSPYHLLADLHERAGNPGAAAAELEQAWQLNDADYDAMLRAAALRLATGDTARAAASLERAVWLHPYDPGVHAQLAELLTTLARHSDAVRERRAVLALEPVNRAEALYQLARALYRAGDAAGARTEVLRALEAAPGFAAAQDLLVEIAGGDS